jgi:lysozyme
MSYEEVKQSIIAHEGKVNKIYKDHLGNATFGIGHLVLPTDDLEEGVEYPDEKIMEIFEKDFEISKEGANLFIPEENIHPTAFGIVIEMCFQLGLPRLQKFKRFHYHLNKCEYEESAAEMLDSVWAKKQTPNRAKALADKMKSI